MARILVVDDDRATGALMLQALRPLGHQVVATTDAREGLLRLMRGSYDLVMLDAHASAVPAGEFLQRLEALPDRDDTAVVLLARRMEPPTSRSRRIVGCLSKPFIVPEVERVVRDALRAAAKPCRDLDEEASLFGAMVELQDEARATAG